MSTDTKEITQTLKSMKLSKIEKRKYDNNITTCTDTLRYCLSDINKLPSYDPKNYSHCDKSYVQCIGTETIRHMLAKHVIAKSKNSTIRYCL